MRSMLLVAAVPACLLSLAVGPAMAGDDAELERVRNAIEEAIAPSDALDMPRLELAEPVSAVPQGDGIVVTLKQARLIAPEDDATLVIGDIELALQPRGADYYAFDVTMPQRFEIMENGVAEGVLTIGSYKISGIWAGEVESLTRLDASIASIEARDLTPATDNFGAVIDSFEAKLEYAKGANGLWSGSSSARLAGIKVHTEDSPNESDDLVLAAIETSSSTEGWDWNGWHRVMKRFKESVMPDAAPLSEVERETLANDIRSVIWGVNEGAVTFKGLSVGASGEHLFDLGDFTWKLGFDGTGEAGPLSIRLAMADLAVTENQLPSELAPSNAVIDVTLEDFPVRAFIGSFLAQLVNAENQVRGSESAEPAPAMEPMEAPPESVDEAPPDPAMEGAVPMETPDSPDGETMPSEPMQEHGYDDGTGNMDEPGNDEPWPEEQAEGPMMGPLPMDDPFFQKIFSLGTSILLNELSIEAPTVGVTASGRVHVDPEAMGMGTGRLKATVRGIDSVLAFVESESRHDPEMKDISTFLIFLKGLGKAEVGPGNEVVYVYDLDVPKEEPPTVNGYLLDDMMFN